jgi:uncharacterized protein
MGLSDMGGYHGRFVWYELVTTDMESAKAFYASVVGWHPRNVSTSGPAYRLFTIQDSPVAGLMNAPENARSAGVTPHWMGYVGVDDVDAAVDRIKQLGGVVHVPPTNVPGVSRFSVVTDPQMATLALVKGMNSGQARSVEPGAPGRVGWHELLATDSEKAFAFYGELFGWQKAEGHTGVMGAYQGFSAGGELIGGMFTKPAELALPFWLYYFNIDDIEEAAQRVEAGGGQIVYGPTAVPGGALIVHCTDPQGAIFALLDKRSRKTVGYVYLERVAPHDPLARRAPHGLDQPRTAETSVGSVRFRDAADRKLTDWPLDVELDARHLCEQFDVRDPDRTPAELHVGRHQVERLHQGADVLQNERIGDRTILPGNPAKARGDRDQDLGRGGSAHCVLGARQQRFELISGDADRRKRVSVGVVMIEAAQKPFAQVDGQIELELVSSACRRIRPAGVTAFIQVEL